ncbi:PTS lactose/cellobiose transporter subunit IIA [Listeria booriae]|uniref:PTS system lactose-specific EIIA component n=1 Tax=Listeria booriae TaxID=1552123 RepID=A0A7X0XRY7_9LIST|nr:PTS lactose/cellobiose transporter subunit IIA [Listeria booriae]MBC1779182.1 PTS lactose/cellobiose transporter subunit IIA [Listeria booriae]MBC2243081.1 PTS lactose/cellobiose transporter subunit IIA [Listeria booriae]
MDAEKISFLLISLAGDSFSKLVEALQEAKVGNKERVAELLAESDALMNEAHRAQTDLMVQESRGESCEMSVLLVHAQDTLMNTILASTLIREMIEMYGLFRPILEKGEI